MKQLVIFPRGTLSAKDKERMSKEGYLAIETDEPEKVKIGMGEIPLTGNQILTCAMDALCSPLSPHAVQARFAENFRDAMKKATPN